MTPAGWRSSFVPVDGAQLHVARVGSGRQPLVLLHGLTDDGRCWAPVVAQLAADYDLLVPDARAHGRSSGIDTEGFTVPRLAADVAGILEALAVTDALVWGHSMGAITAATLAADRPDLVRGLVLEDPPLDPPFRPLDTRREEMRLDLESWRGLEPSMRHDRAALVHPEWGRAETDPWSDAKADVDPAVGDHLGLFDGYDWRGVLGRLSCPGLLITGAVLLGALVDPEVADEAIALWPAGEVLHVRGAGHCVHRDRPAETIEPVMAWLRRAARQPPRGEVVLGLAEEP